MHKQVPEHWVQRTSKLLCTRGLTEEIKTTGNTLKTKQLKKLRSSDYKNLNGKLFKRHLKEKGKRLPSPTPQIKSLCWQVRLRFAMLLSAPGVNAGPVWCLPFMQVPTGARGRGWRSRSLRDSSPHRSPPTLAHALAGTDCRQWAEPRPFPAAAGRAAARVADGLFKHHSPDLLALRFEVVQRAPREKQSTVNLSRNGGCDIIPQYRGRRINN